MTENISNVSKIGRYWFFNLSTVSRMTANILKQINIVINISSLSLVFIFLFYFKRLGNKSLGWQEKRCCVRSWVTIETLVQTLLKIRLHGSSKKDRKHHPKKRETDWKHQRPKEGQLNVSVYSSFPGTVRMSGGLNVPGRWFMPVLGQLLVLPSSLSWPSPRLSITDMLIPLQRG